MNDKIFNLPISTNCQECGSDLEIADFDTVRVGEKMVLQFNVKTCEKCKEAWIEEGEEEHQRAEDAIWDVRRDR